METMFRHIHIMAAALLALVSCNRDVVATGRQNSITFSCISQETKAASGISEVPSSIYAAASTVGATERTLWNTTCFTKGGTVYSAGKYWPMSGNLNFYASNRNSAFTLRTGGCTQEFSVTHGDIIAAYARNVAHGSTANLAFEHVFSWIAGFKLKTIHPSASAKIKSVSIVAPKTSGTYDYTSGTFTSSTQGGNYVYTSSAVFGNTFGGIGCSDFILPGTYSVSVTYTVSYGSSWSQEYTRSGKVTLERGQKAVISITLGDEYGNVTFGVTPIAWSGSFNIQENI